MICYLIISRKWLYAVQAFTAQGSQRSREV